MSGTACRELVALLVKAVPRLRALYEEHISWNDELLPHVLFGDITRFIMEGLAAEGKALQDAKRVLAILEHAMGSADEDVQNLVSVSFLENLDQEASMYESIRAALGPNLRKELRHYE